MSLDGFVGPSVAPRFRPERLGVGARSNAIPLSAGLLKLRPLELGDPTVTSLSLGDFGASLISSGTSPTLSSNARVMSLSPCVPSSKLLSSFGGDKSKSLSESPDTGLSPLDPDEIASPLSPGP